MHAFMTPNDSYYSYQWNFNAFEPGVGGGINLEPAWDISTGDDVIVAVLDTGVAYENYDTYIVAPDLKDTDFVQGYDFINDDCHPNDDYSHGTHVAGTIAQSTNNGIGVAGVAFNCSIMPVKVLAANGSGDLQQLVDGIYFATNNSADVISMSLGYPPRYYPGPVLDEALDYAHNRGVTIVAAAGNDNTRVVSYPAAYEKCIAVGATRYDGTRAYYSNYGSALDVMAPGGDTRVDQNNDGYADGVLQNTFNHTTKDQTDFAYWFFQGTSMATPHVSGVAALLISAGANGPDEVRAAIESTTKDLGTPGWDKYYGNGLVDANAALEYITSTPTPPTNDNFIHIEDVSVTTTGVKIIGKTYVTATTIVTIRDSSNNPIEGATVSGDWSGSASGTDSAVTDGTGTVTFSSDEVILPKKSTLTFTFTVNDVSHMIQWDGNIASGTAAYP